MQRDEVGSSCTITEEEARQYYLAHQGEFIEPATVTLREILIEVPTTTQQGQAGVNVGDRRRGGEAGGGGARAPGRGGEDFAKVAAEVSAPASKANGGLIGPIAVTRDLAESLQKLIERDEAGRHHAADADVARLSDSQARDAEGRRRCSRSTACAISSPSAVHSDRQRQEVRKFLDRVRSQAIIEWKNAELQKAYEQQVAQPGQMQASD